MTRKLDYPVFDADNHMYEATEAFTKYLPAEYDGVIKYVEVNGRTKIAIKNKISDYIPNPTFNKVAPPGAQELEFKLKNPDSMTAADKEMQLAPPPRYIEAPDAFFEPEARVMMMDEQGIDRAMMWPTLASLLEERLTDDPVTTHVVIHALNQWMHETWTFNYENRIFPTPVITLPIVEVAIKELDWVTERGAKIVLIRPAPVPGFRGRRSFALPEFDPFWELVQERDIVVGMHASDSGYQRYINEWEGVKDDEFTPFSGGSGFSAIVGHAGRPIIDTMASAVGHGLCSRFPGLKIVPVENGSGWVRQLLEDMAGAYAFNPHLFPEDPVM